MDSPAHVVAGARYLDELTPPELIAPAIKLDLRGECRDRADYDVSEVDIAAFEAANGPITPGSLVLLRASGVDLHTPDFDALAAAVGVSHRLLDDAAKADDVLADAVEAHAPVLVEVDVAAIGPMPRPFVPPVEVPS